MANIADDPRLDPRIKNLLLALPGIAVGDVTSRDELLAEANTPEAKVAEEGRKAFMEVCDNDTVSPSTGLRIDQTTAVSQPDGNTINLQIIRPDTDEKLACVYYIHGGGMQALSCMDGNYRAFGKIIAAFGVAVVMVDFRNSISPSSVPDGCPISGRSQRLCFRPQVDDRECGILEHRHFSHRRGGRKWRRQPHAGDRPQVVEGRRNRPHQGLVRVVPIHRWPMAASGESIID